MARSKIRGARPSFDFDCSGASYRIEIAYNGEVTLYNNISNEGTTISAADAVHLGDALSTAGLRALAMKRGDV